MRLSLHTDYALRFLMFLVSRPERTTIAEVAGFFEISKDHLAKVAQRMVRLGYVRSIRGINGGIELTKSPDEITIGQVIRDFEGAMHYLECVGATTTVCVIQPGCALRGVFAEAERLQWEYLDSVKLSSVVNPKLDLVQLKLAAPCVVFTSGALTLREFSMSRRLAWALVPVVLIGSVVAQLKSADKPAKPDPAAVERARKQVRMLDDLYKTAVVLITEHYVHDEKGLAAGSAARLLFKSMKDKGWHDARLIDATGEPYEEKNAPADEFEKSAITQLKAGKTFVDTVIEKDGKPYLRAATPVPVVMDKCILCHAHYKNVEKGQPIGAIGYIVPIE